MGDLYVVLIVVLLTWGALFLYMVRVERRIKELESRRDPKK